MIELLKGNCSNPTSSMLFLCILIALSIVSRELKNTEVVF